MLSNLCEGQCLCEGKCIAKVIDFPHTFMILGKDELSADSTFREGLLELSQTNERPTLTGQLSLRTYFSEVQTRASVPAQAWEQQRKPPRACLCLASPSLSLGQTSDLQWEHSVPVSQFLPHCQLF